MKTLKTNLDPEMQISHKKISMEKETKEEVEERGKRGV